MNRQKIRKGIILFSFFLFPATFYYFSPVLIIEASGKGIVNGSFIVFLMMFFSALFLGRAFCGWVCPGAGCQEAIFSVRSKKVIKGYYLKWLIWVPWLSVIAIMAIKSGGYRRIDFFFETTYGFSVANVHSLMTYFFVLILLIVLPAFIFGKRSFCHHLCWMAPFMIIGRKIRNYFSWSSLQIVADPSLCKHCHTCITSCPMSLPVEEMVSGEKIENSECVLCGTCVDGCKQGVLKFKWGRV